MQYPKKKMSSDICAKPNRRRVPQLQTLNIRGSVRSTGSDCYAGSCGYDDARARLRSESSNLKPYLTFSLARSAGRQICFSLIRSGSFQYFLRPSSSLLPSFPPLPSFLFPFLPSRESLRPWPLLMKRTKVTAKERANGGTKERNGDGQWRVARYGTGLG